MDWGKSRLCGDSHKVPLELDELGAQGKDEIRRQESQQRKKGA